MVLSLPGWANKTSANLTPAPGRQDHTTSPSAKASLVCTLRSLTEKSALRSRHALKRCRVHRIQPPVRDDRDTPLCGVDEIDIDVIWVRCEAEYFCKWDWT